LFGKSEESAAAANRQRTETLGQMRNKDADVATAAANRLNNIEVEKLRIAERQAERNQPGSAAKVRAEYLKMMDQVFALEDKGEKAQADALRRRADARLTAGGGTGTASERNDIKATETLLKNQQAIISDPLSSKADKEEARRKAVEYTRQLEKLGGVGGGTSASAAQAGKVVDFNSLPK
jgi:protein involved in temperature-dependent protein secretion